MSVLSWLSPHSPRPHSNIPYLLATSNIEPHQLALLPHGCYASALELENLSREIRRRSKTFRVYPAHFDGAIVFMLYV